MIISRKNDVALAAELLVTLATRAQTGTVVLVRGAGSTVVAGAQVNEAGTFDVAAVPLGTYVLRGTAVGYRTNRRAVSFTIAAPTLAPGVLRLRPASTQLKDVVVTAEHSVISGGLDKKVVDVTKGLTATGGTAVDVLQNVPSVTVDQTGAVSVHRASNVTIFIDGKPTGTTLDQIPASRVADVFNTLRFDSNDSGDGFATVPCFKRESRIVYLGFTYCFGQTQKSRARRQRVDNEGGSEN